MDAPPPIASTTAGRLSGDVEANGVLVFRGVPYGADTSGAARFQPPSPPTPWQGVRPATAFAHVSPQAPSASLSLAPDILEVFGLGGEDAPSGEDCLALNVWTPSLSGRRPVMVWLHGGGFTSGFGGAAGRGATWGDKLAAENDLVVVTLNHRLGCLGFLDLSAVDPQRFAASGNVGMLDIVAALAWVRDNIARFGGDPGNVTLFGESGGGMKVATLMAMPAAAHLLRRGIMQSGIGVVDSYAFGQRASTPEASRAFADEILAELGLGHGDIDQLLDLPSATIIQAQGAVIARRGIFGGPVGLMPVDDGETVMGDLFRSAQASGKPIVIGTTTHEVATMVVGQPWYGRLEPEGVAKALRPLIGPAAEPLVAAYRAVHPQVSPTRLLVLILSDRWRLVTAEALASRAGAGGSAPAYLYEFAYETDALDGRLGANHAVDIAFAFNTPERLRISGQDPARLGVATAMSRAWASFARDGAPCIDQGPAWPPYRPGAPAVMRLDRVCTLSNILPDAIQRAWDAAGGPLGRHPVRPAPVAAEALGGLHA